MNGETPTVVAGGLDLGTGAVANGSVKILFNTSNELFTAEFVSDYAGAMPCLVGFNYTSDGQIVRIATQQESGARIGPGFGKFQRHDLISVLLTNTQAIKFGTTFDSDGMNIAQLETAGGSALSPLQLYSGMLRHALTDAPSPGTDSMVCWRIDKPFPACISALGGFLRTEDQ
jgi:hypothetical protein